MATQIMNTLGERIPEGGSLAGVQNERAPDGSDALDLRWIRFAIPAALYLSLS